MYPEIFYTKMMLRKTLESRDILMFVDVHGHSRKKNFFMFGCSNKSMCDRLKERIFPMMFSKKNCQFGFKDCNFNMNKEKESTARVVVWKEFNIINSFTLECSFLGPDGGVF